jgi:putative nucleotidyltransferase with HDIG domain
MFSLKDHDRITAITAFADAVMGLRDPRHDAHQKRTAKLSVDIALELNLSPDFIELMKWSAHLHDVGKMMIAEVVLSKQKLSAAEMEMVHSHAELGEKALRGLNFDPMLNEIILHHHENWDGTGYPDGLMGNDIPLGARIIRIADTFDAMTSERIYRRTFTKEEALIEMEKENAVAFDPILFGAFKRVME